VVFRGRPSARVPIGDRLQIGLGLLPLAGYLVAHLVTQASALWGPRAHAVWGSAEPRPLWFGLEVAVIYLPLLVHVGLGARRVARRPALVRERIGAASLGPLIQPLSGLVLLGFLLVHVYEFRFRLWTGVLAPSDYYPELCASLSSTRWGGVPGVAIGYLLGIAAAALHAAHGLHRGALALGLVAAGRERAWGRCCSALGIGVFGLGALIVIDLATGSVLIHLPGS
jgi:succinate dehydrogenase / fumarate reductase, cytochrome b subunit